MASPSYKTSPSPDGGVLIETTPAMPLGVFGTILYMCTMLFISLVLIAPVPGLIPSIVVGLASLLLGLYGFFRAGERSLGRKRCAFTANQTGIILSSGEQLSRSDIATLYIIAPSSRKELFDYSKRAWRVVVEARGKEYVLCGGLTESMARAVLVEIKKATGIVLK